jgi:DNA-binding transcriptional MerR regulator
MAKAADAFRTISEVADDLGIQKHVLRFWEVKFNQIRPMKRGGGRRYYRPEDMELLRGIRQLLHRDGYTIKGVQKILREQGVEAVKVRARSEEEAAMAVRGVEVEGSELGSGTQPEAAGAGARRDRGRTKAAAAPVDRSEVLRAIIAELVACREMLGPRPAAEGVAETRGKAALRPRRSA